MTSRRIEKVEKLHKSNNHNQMKVAVYENKLEKHSNPQDKIYLNLVIPYQPNNNGISQAIFQQQFTQPVLDVPDDYYLSIVRFSIPCQNIPIINFANYIQNFPNTNPNLTVFSVTLEYNGDISQSYVQFATETPFASPGVLSVTNPTVAYNNVYYFTYTYSNIIAMINGALSDAFTGLASPPMGSLAPYLIYDPVTYRIGLVAQKAFYVDTLPTPIEVFVNYELFSTFLSGMPSVLFGYNEANEEDVQLVIREQHNNGFFPEELAPPYSGSGTPLPSDYYVMWQDYPTLINMNSFKNLTFRSNLLPIVQEFSVSNNLQTSVQTSLSTIGSVGILTNFEPLDTFGWESRGIVTYTPLGPYHLINLTGMAPISNLDITILWSDQFGQLYPLTIGYNQVATIKIAFFKKDTFTS